MAAHHDDQRIGAVQGALPRGRESLANATDSGPLAATMPPRPLKDLLTAGGANLYVLSADAELIEMVQRAGGAHYPVFAVQQWDEIETAILAERCGIALLDADTVGKNLVDRIKAMQAHATRVVTLVAADRSAAQELMSYLSDRQIHRLLIKPATLGITRLLIESAVNRCLQLRDLAAESGDLETRLHDRGRNRAWRWPHVAFGLLVVTGLVATGTWLWTSKLVGVGATQPLRLATAAPQAVSRDTDAAEGEGRFADLLNRGDRALKEGRLAAPTGNNALDNYLTILSQDPGEPTAQARLAVVVDALFAQAESALLANSLDDAEAALKGVRRAESSSSRLAFLEAQLARATAARSGNSTPQRAAALRESTSSAAAAAAPTELDSLLVIANARMARGQLLDPAGDSAVEYLRRAGILGGTDPRVIRSRAALAAALLQAARVAIGSDGLDDAGRFINAAQDLGGSAEDLAALQLELASSVMLAAEHRHSEWLALASSRLRAGALTEPVGDSSLDYLRRVQTEALNAEGLSAVWDEWLAAQSVRARQAIAANNWAAAEAAVTAMAVAPRGAVAATPLREQLKTERLQSEYLAAASPSSELKLLESPPPLYPPDALRQNVQGWVELEFVVDRIGRPKNAIVVASEPSSRFDQAALAAVAKYRYAPFETGQHVYERRVRLRIRFALN